MNLRPLADRVIVEPDAAPTKSAGGLYLPTTPGSTEPPTMGKVVAVGSGKVLDDGTVKPLSVKKGDHVIYGSYAGTPVQHEKKEYRIIAEHEILAIIQ